MIRHSTYRIEPGDNRDVLKKLIEEGVQVDAILTDPPFGLKFMNKKWDYNVPSVKFFKLVFRILKPGGYLLAFGGTRTYHRMVVNIEDAGFEIRDSIAWIYGTGFPKSLDVSKAIDKAAGADREVIGTKKGVRTANGCPTLNQLSRPEDNNNPDAKTCGAHGVGVKQEHVDLPITAPATPEAQQWDGWGAALKPAMELIVVARKPLEEKTIAANVLKHGTGAINIDACRVGSDGGCKQVPGTLEGQTKNNCYGTGLDARYSPQVPGLGRFPANVILDEEAGKMLDEQSGYSKSRKGTGTRTIPTSNEIKLVNSKVSQVNWTYDDQGGVSRFFYCPKASKAERRGSKHPTVKPLELMRYLCRLVTPPGGVVLDPFAGTGTTGEAALLEGFYPILIELEPEYVKDIKIRLADTKSTAAARTEPMEMKFTPAQGQETKETDMSKQKQMQFSMRDDIPGPGRSENGRKIIDCEECNAKGIEEGAFGLCFACYRRQKRATVRKATNMTLPAQRKEQVRVMKLFSTLEQAAVALGFDRDDINHLRLLAAPYVEVVPWLLGADSVNSEQEAA
jgi:site-specific DNA-methyltransferase (adenine-specific)